MGCCGLHLAFSRCLPGLQAGLVQHGNQPRYGPVCLSSHIVCTVGLPPVSTSPSLLVIRWCYTLTATGMESRTASASTAHETFPFGRSHLVHAIWIASSIAFQASSSCCWTSAWIISVLCPESLFSHHWKWVVSTHAWVDNDVFQLKCFFSLCYGQVGWSFAVWFSCYSSASDQLMLFYSSPHLSSTVTGISKTISSHLSLGSSQVTCQDVLIFLSSSAIHQSVPVTERAVITLPQVFDGVLLNCWNNFTFFSHFRHLLPFHILFDFLGAHQNTSDIIYLRSHRLITVYLKGES